MRKRWSKTEIAHLERNAARASLEELAQKLNTDTDTVLRQLEKLGLTAQGQPMAAADSALESYTQALRAMHEKKWSEAAALFEQVIAETDDLQITDRARQSLATCRRYADPVDEGVDPYLEAVVEKNRGNVEAALELCLAQGKEGEDERYAYLLASLHSLTGSAEQALEHLETAIRLEPKNRIHAYHDPDFAELRGQEEFADLVAGPGS